MHQSVKGNAVVLMNVVGRVQISVLTVRYAILQHMHVNPVQHKSVLVERGVYGTTRATQAPTLGLGAAEKTTTEGTLPSKMVQSCMGVVTSP